MVVAQPEQAVNSRTKPAIIDCDVHNEPNALLMRITNAVVRVLREYLGRLGGLEPAWDEAWLRYRLGPPRSAP